MAEARAKAEKDLDSLKSTVESVLSLISQLLAVIKTNVPSNEKKIGDVNSIDLAHDAATLIKAHSTKLSLLIINNPFTPTAIMTVLREVLSGPLPALAASVELCTADIYTTTLQLELQWRAEKVLIEFQRLIRDIPLNGKILSNERKNGTMVGMGKGSLAATGVVWGACDQVVELKKLGIAGLMIKKAEQYRDTIKDALEELKEWGEETSEDEAENDCLQEASVNENGSCNLAQDAIDSMFSEQRHIPANDANKIRERLEYTLRRLKLIALLYQSITKRRLKTLPSISYKSDSSTIVARLDALVPLLSHIPDSVDELASAFYSLDDSGINSQMRECFQIASSAAELLTTNWEGNQDEFSEWSKKFQVVMAEEW